LDEIAKLHESLIEKTKAIDDLEKSLSKVLDKQMALQTAQEKTAKMNQDSLDALIKANQSANLAEELRRKSAAVEDKRVAPLMDFKMYGEPMHQITQPLRETLTN